MQNPLRHAVLAALACSLAVPLGGCRLFGSAAPSSSLYMLDPGAQPAVAGARLGSVSVRQFTSIAPFDSSAFVYRNTDGSWRIDPYDGFAAEPAAMVSAAVVRALDASTRFDLVAYDTLAARTDYLLEGVVEDFHSDFREEGAHESTVRLRIYISRRHGAGRGLVFSAVGDGRAPIAAQTPGAVADALSEATRIALAQLVRSLPECFRDAATAPPQGAPAGTP